MDNISKEQFEEILLDFLDWTGDRERPVSAWLLSLEDWTKIQFSKALRVAKRKL